METKQLELRSVMLAIERGLHGFPGIAELKVYPKSAEVAIIYDLVATEQKRMKIAETPTK